MRSLTLSDAEILWMEQVGVGKTGVFDVLLLAQAGGCKTGVSAVLWLAQVGDCGTWVGNVLFLAQVDGVGIDVLNILLQDQCGMIQETIKDGWLCNFTGSLRLLALSFFSCLLGAVPL